ncbi:TIM barrel protein [Candidatus Micrarchaeota archaeon]|nr:TIM barrel protein [Candidatus Micrarchaeota archaeon]
MIRFGPAGIPLQCKGSSTIDGVACCHDLGLDAMEMEFVHGVKLKEESAEEIEKISRKFDISLSSHAPYYINLCSKEDEKIQNSIRHIFESAKITAIAGGRITVFHPGFYQKLSPDEAFSRAKSVLQQIQEKLIQHSIKIVLGAETVGKKSAFGSLEENIRLSEELEMVEPVIDFAHLLARGDYKLKSEDDYRAILEKLEKRLDGYVKHFHSHFSEIAYSEKGERNHLVLGEKNEPPFKPLMKVLAENGYSGTVICESPQIDFDALKMQKEYWRVKKCL